MARLKSFLRFIVFAPIAAAIILFAIANRAPVKVSLDPFNRDAPALVYNLPLYLVVLAAIGAGVIAGGLGAWLGQSRHRKAERALRRETSTLRAEAERLKAAQMARSASAPALPEPR